MRSGCAESELKASLTNLDPLSNFKMKGNTLLGGNILAKHEQGPGTISGAVINRHILSNWMHSNEPAIAWTLRVLPLPARFLHLLPLIPVQTLCRVGCKASFQQLCGVDHFDIIENLTREEDELTQVGLNPSPPTTLLMWGVWISSPENRGRLCGGAWLTLAFRG